MPLKRRYFSTFRTMMDFIKSKLQWIFTRLYPKSVLIVRWSQMVDFLAEKSEIQQHSSKFGFLGKLPANWAFLLWKVAHYSFICSISVRFALVSYLQFTRQPIEPYGHLLGPLFIVSIEYFQILNLPHAMAAYSLLAFDALYVDFLVFFKLDTELLDISVDLLVKNRRHFRQLYGDLTFWEKTRFLGEMRKASNGKHKSTRKLRNFLGVPENILAKAYLLGDIVETAFAGCLIAGRK